MGMQVRYLRQTAGASETERLQGNVHSPDYRDAERRCGQPRDLTCFHDFWDYDHSRAFEQVSGSIRSARCAIGALQTETTSHW